MANSSALPTQIEWLQGTASNQGATVNGNGTTADCKGYATAQILEIFETQGGTCTITIQGSYGGPNWYTVGYEQLDGQATLTRSVSAISVTANSAHTYKILDSYNLIRAVITSISGAGIVARIHLWP